MEEEQPKRIEEPLERLKKVGGHSSFVQSPEVVEALKIHGELVDRLAKSNQELVKLNERLIESNEKLLKSSEKTERWTKALLLVTFALVLVALVQLVTASNVQLSFWQTLAVVIAVGVLVGLIGLCIGAAWGMLVLPKRKG